QAVQVGMRLSTKVVFEFASPHECRSQHVVVVVHQKRPGMQVPLGTIRGLALCRVKDQTENYRKTKQPCNPHAYQALTWVVPPPSKERLTGWFVFQNPAVKSGTSMELDRFATDHSLKGAIALRSTPSYTSSSCGRPFRSQPIKRQSIMKSMPPCPPIFFAISPTLVTISGVYCSSSVLNSSCESQLCPVAMRAGEGHFRATPLVPLTRWILE